MAAAATPTAGHRRKQRIPPGPAARAAAEALRHPDTSTVTSTEASLVAGTDAKEVVVDTVIDLARYAAAAEGRNTLR
jgi:hypothetical protein